MASLSPKGCGFVYDGMCGCSAGTAAAVEADACRPCAECVGIVLAHPLSRVSPACLYRCEIAAYTLTQTSIH